MVSCGIIYKVTQGINSPRGSSCKEPKLQFELRGLILYICGILDGLGEEVNLDEGLDWRHLVGKIPQIEDILPLIMLEQDKELN
ncbi:hypothetical protein DSO57_1000543 [Entomophthora muscae]|uniref:Uncharacterized protein n=1 Tax=Entomophthora muscae TaxID=34485 RepID=A0ACC2RP67_9FUNG|nr:hypothetical protein DSO57_1000543 [Entomophthora muscae]